MKRASRPLRVSPEFEDLLFDIKKQLKNKGFDISDASASKFVAQQYKKLKRKNNDNDEWGFIV